MISALNIFKGAKEEGFRTVCICKEKDAIMYEKFGLVDEMIIVPAISPISVSEPLLEEKLRRLNVILILTARSRHFFLSTEQLTGRLHVPMFGNKALLPVEA